MYAFVVGNQESRTKESVLLCCGEDNADDMFDGIVQSYRAIVKNRAWTERGILTVPGVNKPGEITCTDALDKAEAIGKAL